MASKTGSIVDGGKYDVKELLERCNKLEQAFSAQGLKCNPPTLFSEEHGKLRAFLSQMDIYLAVNALKLAGEADKVLLASTFLIGPAFDWFEPRIRLWFHEAKEDRDIQTTRIFNNYTQFTNQLQQTFGNIDEKHSAAQKLYQLKQTESITKYASEYQQLSSHLD